MIKVTVPKARLLPIYCDTVDEAVSLAHFLNGMSFAKRQIVLEERKRGESMPALIIALLPLITNLTPVLIAAIQRIKAQGGLTTDEIIAQAGVQLDANDQKLIDDLKRLGVI